MALLRKLSNLTRLAGCDPRATVRYVGGLPRYLRDVKSYRKLQAAGDTPDAFRFDWKYAKPITADYYESAGTAGGHYFHMDLWAARRVERRRPQRHLDIGSRIDGFVAHVLSFMPVEVIDIRPLASQVPGLSFVQADATNLEQFSDGSVESLSCLHAVEHFGLGRYTDPLDPAACFKAMRAMQRVVRPGGRLIFATPVGLERVEFNAHRVFDPDTILKTFDGLKLLSFSAVLDDGSFVENIEPVSTKRQQFACGLFEFEK